MKTSVELAILKKSLAKVVRREKLLMLAILKKNTSKSSSSGETFDFAKESRKRRKAYNSLTAKPVRTTRPPEKRRKRVVGFVQRQRRMGQSEWLMGQNTIVAKWLMGQNTLVAKWYEAKHLGKSGFTTVAEAWICQEIADEYVVKPIQHHGGKGMNSAKKTAEEYVVKPIQHAGEKVGIDIFGSRDERGNPEYKAHFPMYILVKSNLA